MSVYIKGMEMPKRGHTITITIVGSGQAYVEYFDCRPPVKETIEYTAIPVPDHGRLVDEKDIFAHSEGCVVADGRLCISAKAVWDAPTIIPASKEDT